MPAAPPQPAPHTVGARRRRPHPSPLDPLWNDQSQWFDADAVEVAGAIGRLVKASFRAASRYGPGGREQVLRVLDEARERIESLEPGGARASK